MRKFEEGDISRSSEIAQEMHSLNAGSVGLYVSPGGQDEHETLDRQSTRPIWCHEQFQSSTSLTDVDVNCLLEEIVVENSYSTPTHTATSDHVSLDSHSVTHIEIIKSNIPARPRVDGTNCVVPLLTSVWNRSTFKTSESSLGNIYSKIISNLDTQDDRECHMCYEQFLTSNEVEEHVRKVHSHIIISPELCFVCRKKYISNSLLKAHLSQFHGIQYPELICKICFMEFHTSIEKRAHERKHTKDLSCQFCSFKFASEYMYQKHFDDHMIHLKPYECLKCGKRFSNNMSLGFHRNRHFNLSCFLCKTLFNEELSLLQHVKSHGPEKETCFLQSVKLLDEEENKLVDLSEKYLKSAKQPLDFSSHVQSDVDVFNPIEEEVEKCMETMLSTVSLATDKILEKSEKECALMRSSGFECKVCCLRVETAQELIDHRKKSHLRNRTCLFCGRRSGSVSQTHRHMATHLKTNRTGSTETSVVTNLFCDICNKAFKNKWKFNNHQETVHKLNILTTKRHGCSICSRKFKSSISLDKHLLTHSVNDTLKPGLRCNICQQSFVRSKFLANHMLQHETTHTCTECKRSFLSNMKLKLHMRTHAPIDVRQKFKCNLCAVNCSTLSGLRVHLRIHTNERPYRCSVVDCNKDFKRPQALKKHTLQVHRNNDSVLYACRDCTMTFSDRGNLLRHFLRLHRGLCRFVCGVCANRYGQNQDLRRHLKMKHDISIPKIKGKSKKSVNEIYVLPPVEDTPDSIELVANIKRIVEEEKRKFHGVMDIFNGDNDDPDNPEDVNPSEMSDGTNIQNNSEPDTTLPVQIPELSDNYTQPRSMAGEIVNKEINLELSSEFQPQFLPLLGLLAQLGEHPQVTNESISLQSCDLCQMMFYMDAHFKQHLLKRNENCCQYCEKSFCDQAALQDHVTSVHVITIFYRCGICLVDFTEKIYLTQHMEAIHGVSIHFELTPSDISVSKPHASVVTNAVIPRAINCTPDSGSHLNETMTENAGEQSELTIPVTVEEVGIESHLSALPITFTNQNVPVLGTSSILTFQSSNSLLNILPPSQQALTILEQTSLHPPTEILSADLIPAEQDERRITDNGKLSCVNPSLVCTQCGKEFPEIGRLIRHVKTHLGLKPFKCLHCDRHFSEKHNLKVHNRSHSGIRPFTCPDCGKSMRYHKEFADHLLMHQGLKPHSCVTCGRKFLRQRELTRHQLIHGTEKKHVCESCNKAFCRLDQLRVHTRRRHGSLEDTQLFACMSCPKSFKSKHKLRQHVILHSGEKKHHCPICSKTFALDIYLKSHLRTHKRQDTYVICTKCPRKFSSNSNLEIHLKKFHTKQTKSKKDTIKELAVSSKSSTQLENTTDEMPELEMEELLSAVEMLGVDKSNTIIYFHMVQDDLENEFNMSGK